MTRATAFHSRAPGAKSLRRRPHYPSTGGPICKLAYSAIRVGIVAKLGYKSFDADPGCDRRRYDRGMPDPDWFKRVASIGIPRQRQPGEDVWRLRDPEGVHVRAA